MKKRLMNMSIKKLLIIFMALMLLIIGVAAGVLTIQDNSDPITSGEYMMSQNDPIPIPETMVEVEKTQTSVGFHIGDKKIELDGVIEAGKELISEVSKEFSDEGVKDKAKKVGGFGLGTAFTLYIAYRFIFK
jgi:hypothetical protein